MLKHPRCSIHMVCWVIFYLVYSMWLNNVSTLKWYLKRRFTVSKKTQYSVGVFRIWRRTFAKLAKTSWDLLHRISPPQWCLSPNEAGMLYQPVPKNHETRSTRWIKNTKWSFNHIFFSGATTQKLGSLAVHKNISLDSFESQHFQVPLFSWENVCNNYNYEHYSRFVDINVTVYNFLY